MKCVESAEEYKEIIRRAKERTRRIYTNCYLTVDQVDRYIEKKRLFYSEGEYGCTFYFDEETYYQCMGYYDLEKGLEIHKLNKKILCRYIKKEGKTDQSADLFSERLIQCGFTKKDTTYQYQLDIFAKIDKLEKLRVKSEQMINNQGFTIDFPRVEEATRVNELLYGSGILEDVHFSFRDEDELKKEIEDKFFLCVRDEEGVIRAVNRTYIKNGVAEGDGIVIEEAYKKHGLSVAISTHRYKLLNELGVQYVRGWIIDTNSTSVKYHKGLGWEKNGRMADEWILL